MEDIVLSAEQECTVEATLEYPIDEEAFLIEEAKKDPLAFGKLFDRYYDKILNYTLHRTANIALAEELTSNTFFKALNNLWTFKWRNIPFSAWLYRIASNEVHQYFRKKKHFQSLPLEEYEEIVPDESSQADKELLEAESHYLKQKLFIKIHKSISELKVNYQEVLVLRFFEDKSIKEIGEILGKSEGTIKSLLHRAIAKLRLSLDNSTDLEG
jgi:RNA polymerase sigma-70 factor (ECF subfamily)